jgi:uncharacterized coiled-coil protein SlyX
MQRYRLFTDEWGYSTIEEDPIGNLVMYTEALREISNKENAMKVNFAETILELKNKMTCKYCGGIEHNTQEHINSSEIHDQINENCDKTETIRQLEAKIARQREVLAAMNRENSENIKEIAKMQRMLRAQCREYSNLQSELLDVFNVKRKLKDKLEEREDKIQRAIERRNQLSDRTHIESCNCACCQMYRILNGTENMSLQEREQARKGDLL